MRRSRLLSLCAGCAAASVLAAAASGGAATDAPTGPSAPSATEKTATDKTEANGQAQAVLARVVPYVGLPGVAASIGLTAAQIEGASARSSATAADFGLLGTLVGAAAENSPVAFPSPITADSEGTTQVDRDPVPLDGSDGTKTPDAKAPASFGFAHEQAVATKTPTAARGTVTGPFMGIPGLIEMTGGRSEATSDTKQSVSDVTIGSLNLGAGAVVLNGLHWTATQLTGAKTGTATFSIAGISVAGTALPVDGAEGLAAALTAANTALEPVGLALAGPSSTADTNGGVVAPLMIQIRNPEALGAPTAQAGEAVKPVLNQVVAAMIAAYPSASAAQIVLNAATGAAGGRSGGRLELGGVSARFARLAVADDTASVVPTLPNLNTPGSLPSAGANGAAGKSAVYPGPSDAAAPAPAIDTSVPSGGYTDGAVPAAADPSGAAAAPQSVAAAAPGATGVNTRPVAYGVQDSPGRRTASVALGLGLLAVLGLAIGDRLRIRTLSR